MSVNPGQVSRFLRDYPEYNLLLDNVQFDEEDVKDATKFAIDEFNAMAPITSYTADTFPNDWVMLLGIAAHLMMSETFLQLRNQANYNDGDVERIGGDDKFAAYQALSSSIKSDWKTTAQRLKQQINMESCYGSLSSGYRYIKPGYRNW